MAVWDILSSRHYAWWWHFVFLTSLTSSVESYKIGVGIADITGPSVEISFMGYAKMDQVGQGIHLRQFARTFIIDDGQQRLAFVSADCGMGAHGVRVEVLKVLQKIYGNLYNEQNVMLSGTHTHSTPGGFLMDLLFDINSLGFVQETFKAYVSGIVRSIRRAHDKITEGKVYIASRDVLDASVNRSPTSYYMNPEAERLRYTYDTDKRLVQLSFIRSDGSPMGAFNWFAVHPTSMNNSNTLVSSDNVGYAAVLLEQKMNPGALIGKGSFVGAFVSSNLGDVSPNLQKPRCVQTGLPCDPITSSCTGEDQCIASGPGVDMMDSTRIIAEKLFEGAWSLWTGEKEEVKGPLSTVHKFVEMTNYSVTYFDETQQRNIEVTGCPPAMGYSFAAGTTDGPGAFPFTQSITTPNPLWNSLRDFIRKPSAEQESCHYPKPILLSTGEFKFPFEWQPEIVSTQLALIGNIAIACVPGEFTTMAGRRLRDVLQESLRLNSDQNIIIAGLCNAYSDYVTTFEEYNAQRYEAASTIYGPHTLTIYLDVFRKLAGSLMQRNSVEQGREPPEFLNDLLSLHTNVMFDFAGWNSKFGDVLNQPNLSVHPGDTVSVKFVSGNPRNNLMHEKSYLTVERRQGEVWQVVATDANWETQFRWKRTSLLTGTSEIDIHWIVPQSASYGDYRIRHFGHYKYFLGKIEPYEGTSRTFRVERSPAM